jgi:hypothetical protein
MERMKQQQMEAQMMRKMEIEKTQGRGKIMMNIKGQEDKNICDNTSLLDEFKSSIIFFVIFMILNLTQVNTLICDALSIENNNIYILLKTFVAAVIFFFVNKLVHKYV